MIDIWIRNGQILDGSGSKPYQADVLIEKDKIIDIGFFTDITACTTVDAENYMVAPGFIDMHSHADVMLPLVPEADSLVHQGVTTVVTGNCGISPAPLVKETRREVFQSIGENEYPLPWDRWDSFGSYLEYLQKTGISVNVHPLVGHGMIRAAVMGFEARPATLEEIRKMQNLVERCLDEGAFGISTGLIYPPGSYAGTEELIEVTRPAGKRGGFYFSHVRDEGDDLLASIQEEIKIGRETGVALQHSHYKAAGRENWDKALPGLELIQQANAEGIDITMDMYPYVAGSTGLVRVLPGWAQEGGPEKIFTRLADPASRSKMALSMKQEGFFKVAEWDKVLIPESANPAHVGKYIAELAEESGKSACEWIFDALLETKAQISMVLFLMSEENIRHQMTHPLMMFGTDGEGLPFEGPLIENAPHPRSFGTYPRILGKYVREEHVITLEDAIWRMTGFPAKKLRLPARGFIQKGYQADIVIFDPATIIDTADFVRQAQIPMGIEFVMVNGQFVIMHGRHTHARPGKITTIDS